jgi:glycosyltransferase 2 family protein
MRKFLIALVMMAGIIFAITQLAELENIVKTVQRGALRYILLAVIVQSIWLVNVAALYRSVYRALGIDERFKDLILVAAAANFVNVVTPTAGVGGMAVFISEARRKGYSRGRTTVASAMYVLFDYIGFLMVLAVGLFVLFRRDKLQMTEIAASGVLLLIASVIVALFYLGMNSEQKLGHFLAWMAGIVNKIVRPFRRDKTSDYLQTERSYSFAHDITEGMQELRGKPGELASPLILALSGKALLIIVMFLVFMAFDVPVSAGTLIAGFSIAFLFTIVSPTPNGVGFVEGALTLTLASFYIPLSDAAVVAIIYRGVTFWLPLVFGMLALRWLGGVDQAEPAEG